MSSAGGQGDDEAYHRTRVAQARARVASAWDGYEVAILTARDAGLTFDAIAGAAGVSRQAVYKVWGEALDRAGETPARAL